jgi:hypothetical protein
MISRGKQERQAMRKARLAAALRENLKRRKAQARGRAEIQENQDAAASGESEGNAPDFCRNRSRE